MERRLLVFVVASFCAGLLRAETPVYFADDKLKEAVEAELWISDPTPTDMLALTQLQCQEQRICDLTGLEYAMNLQTLRIQTNRGALNSLSPLAGLTNLRALVIEENNVVDISALAGMTSLQELDLEENDVSSISVLSELTNLQRLGLHRNDISDISPLTNLTSLKWVDLRLNPLNPSAYSTYIPQIKANNPEIWLACDPQSGRRLSISSSAGGTVIHPGQGQFAFECDEVVLVEARADAGFKFIKWTGTFFAVQNPLFLAMSEDHALRANFLSTRAVIYVDDDAQDDPGPGDAARSDPNEGGTLEHPFDSIQEAIDVAPEGTTVLVLGGIYRENIQFRGRNVHVRGFHSDDVADSTWPVIDGAGQGPVVLFAQGENSNCALAEFVVTGGQGTSCGAILCSGSSPTVANCLIVGNRAADWSGGAVRCIDSSAAFINCTIAGNVGGQYGAALYLKNSPAVVVNSIFRDNVPKDILTEGDSRPSVRYSALSQGWPGVGNLHVDPLLVRPGHWEDRDNPDTVIGPDNPNATWTMGDYHLQSQTGRWDSKTRTWQQDELTSPCVDAGDPLIPVGQEPLPNGGIINLGVYGGTLEASRSLSLNPSP